MSVDVTEQSEETALTNFQDVDEAKAASVDVTERSEETDSAAVTESTTYRSSSVVDGIEFAATAGEARKRVSKKKDVRSTSMSMKDKYEIFQKM